MPSSIISPFPVFNDLDGTPLENGYIYIGQSNLNPETAPVNVFWDAARTIPAAQPIRTIGGFPSRNGSPSNIYVENDTYSITVRNSRRVFVYSAFDQTDAPSSVFDISTQVITATAGQTTFTLTVFTYLPGTDTLQVYRNGLRLTSGTDYAESNSSTVTLTTAAAAGDEFLFQGGAVISGNNIPGTGVSFIQAGTGAVARSMQDKARESVSVKDFGAVADGITNDLAAFQAAYDAVATDGVIYVPNGQYKVLGTVVGTSKKVTWIIHGKSTGATAPYFNDGNLPHRIKQITDGHSVNYDSGSLILNDVDGAYWALRESVEAVYSKHPSTAIVGYITNETDTTSTNFGGCSVSGFIIGTQPNELHWGLYSDLQLEASATDAWMIGLEVAAKNKGADKNGSPYVKDGGVIGIWLAAGGDPVYGGSPANPSNTGLAFEKNGSTWNKGIVFNKDSLTGCDGINGVATAIAMAKGHQIEWWANGTTNKVAYIRSDIDSEAAFQRIAFANGGMSLGTETFDFLKLLRVNNAANGLTVYPNTTGAPVILVPSESNGYIKVQANGTGEFETGSNFVPSTDNAVSVGRSGKRFTSIWAANGTIQTSDEREKTDISNSELGLSFINSLRPVSYRFKVGENVIVEKDEIGNPVAIEQKPGERRHFGLLAQEVKAALPSGVDFGGWILTDKNDPESQQGLRYEQFIAPLIKAVQELSAQLSSLNSA